MLILNSKRVRKSSGTKQDNQRRENELSRKRSRISEDSPNPSDLTKDERGIAKSQSNPWAKDAKEGRSGYWSDFKSSNIDGIDYDPEKKQLWVRFVGGDVYTYFDVPISIARGFYSTPSKGRYFWKKIRRNKHIRYQKLTAERHWIDLENSIDLDFSVQEAKKMRKMNSRRPNYLRRKLNSARNGEISSSLSKRAVNSSRLTVMSAPESDTDEEFLDEMSSVLSLESGETLDLSVAYLAYNSDTQELILTDDSESQLDDGFEIVGRITQEVSDVSDMSEEEVDEESEPTEEAESEEVIGSEDSEGTETEESGEEIIGA